MKRFFISSGITAIALGFIACGDRAEYELLEEDSSQANINSDDAVGSEGDGDAPGNAKGQGNSGVIVEGAGEGESDPPPATEGSGTEETTEPEVIEYDNQLEEDCEGEQECIDEGHVIADASEEEQNDLNVCLANWGHGEFGKEIPDFREVYATVSIGGHGTVLKDVEPTEEPELVLVHAGVNVGGDIIYKFLNPNGYYCINVDVAVFQNLTIKLHCDAHLSDTKVNVNVGSNVNDSPAKVSVAVGSNINIIRYNPNGGHCPE